METGKPVSTVVFIIALVIVGITAWQFGYRNVSNKNIESYKEMQKIRLAGTGMFMPEGTEVKQLSGTIKSINGKSITVFLSYPKDSFSDPLLDERNITLDSNTIITLSTEKDETIFQKELEEYQSKIRAGESGVSPPQIFDKKPGDLSMLKVGQMINITTADNVRNQKSFTALTVDILLSQSVSRPNL